MKRAIRNVLGVAGLLLMMASLIWISFHQEKHPAVYKESKPAQPQKSKPFAVVVLDPGHGGEDSGAMCGGVMEKDLTLDIASGVETYYAAHQINSGATFASWLPFFSQPPLNSPKPESQSLAGFIQEALVARTRSIDRGTQAKQFFVIANVTSPAVLIEGGFITNKDELSKLVSEDYRDQLAAAVADGVLRYRDAVSLRKSALAATGQKSTE